MSVKRKYNKANIHINGKFVPSNKGKFIVDAEYVRDDRTDKSLNETLDNVENAVDDLFDGNGKIKSDLLPSYVDDIHEFEEFSDFPETGETGIIYLDLETGYTYRWSGSEYVVHQAQADWNQNNSTAPDYIKNKPSMSSLITAVYSIVSYSDDVIKVNIPGFIGGNSQSLMFGLNINTPILVTNYLKVKINNEYEYPITYYVNGTGNYLDSVQLYDILYLNYEYSTLSLLGIGRGNPAVINTHVNSVSSGILSIMINNSTLIPNDFYYDTTNAKLLMATSNNTLVEISTTPYTPSV